MKNWNKSRSICEGWKIDWVERNKGNDLRFYVHTMSAVQCANKNQWNQKSSHKEKKHNKIENPYWLLVLKKTF